MKGTHFQYIFHLIFHSFSVIDQEQDLYHARQPISGLELSIPKTQVPRITNLVIKSLKSEEQWKNV